ncbi:TatD family hydrolase [Facilibium subflavum]|uniref:TatD family hydrolase n=1 Tax=Facilibium subflavum TaxID=2219058 RepID=UPI000E653EC0|nr:TatD family hydrolase [Facilibium subflavum]
MIIDSHCHLNSLRLDGISLDDVLKEAKDHEVDQIISIGTTLEEIEAIQQIALAYDDVFFSAGVHPSEIEGIQPTKAEDIIAYAQAPKCVGIGETGLDYYYNDALTHAAQKEKFLAHMDAACCLNKPVIVHTRGAKQDTLAILKQGSIDRCGGVLHCFTEDWDMAKKALDMGMYISFSGIVTFKNAQTVQEVAKKVPLDRILIETDAPYLTPVPYRGKPNYPAYVYYVAEFMASLRKENFAQFCAQTKANTQTLFSLPNA